MSRVEAPVSRHSNATGADSRTSPGRPFSLVQINLQPHFGGGEVYTAFLCRALSTLGVPTRLLVHPRAGFWDRLGLPADTERIAVAGRTKPETAAARLL